MEPIISPWVIYAVQLLDNLRDVAMILFVLSGIASVLLAIPVILDDKDLPKKYLKKAVIIAAICGGMDIIIPNKETMITMIAASYITPDNVQMTQGNIVEFIKQISEAVQNGK
jgi:uncharacterized membrane protein